MDDIACGDVVARLQRRAETSAEAHRVAAAKSTNRPMRYVPQRYDAPHDTQKTSPQHLTPHTALNPYPNFPMCLSVKRPRPGKTSRPHSYQRLIIIQQRYHHFSATSLPRLYQLIWVGAHLPPSTSDTLNIPHELERVDEHR